MISLEAYFQDINRYKNRLMIYEMQFTKIEKLISRWKILMHYEYITIWNWIKEYQNWNKAINIIEYMKDIIFNFDNDIISSFYRENNSCFSIYKYLEKYDISYDREYII